MESKRKLKLNKHVKRNATALELRPRKSTANDTDFLNAGDHEGYLVTDTGTIPVRYYKGHYISHPSSYYSPDDDWVWCAFLVGILVLFLLFIPLAIYAPVNGHHHHWDDDDGSSMLVGKDVIIAKEDVPYAIEVSKGMENSPEEQKKIQAFKVLSSSVENQLRSDTSIKSKNVKAAGKAERNRHGRKHRKLAKGVKRTKSQLLSDSICPKGTNPVSAGEYAFLSGATCLPTYPLPIAVDYNLIGARSGEEQGKRECDSFYKHACSKWEGIGKRSFTYSSILNEKILSLVQQVDGIADKFVWNPGSGDIPKEQGSESLSTEQQVFSTFTKTCHSALSNPPHSVEQAPLSEILSKFISSVLVMESDDWSALGKHFGFATCLGVSPLMFIRSDVDIFNATSPILYIQPKGAIGVAPLSTYHKEYLQEACKLAARYGTQDSTPVNRKSSVKEFTQKCIASVSWFENTTKSIFRDIAQEKRRKIVDDLNDNNSIYNGMDKAFNIYLATGKKLDGRQPLKQAGSFFNSDFFAGFLNSLETCGSCVMKSATPENINKKEGETPYKTGRISGQPADLTELFLTSTIDKSKIRIKRDVPDIDRNDLNAEDVFIWQEYPSFFEAFHERLQVHAPAESPFGDTTSPIFEAMKYVAIAAMASDNLEVTGYYSAYDFKVNASEQPGEDKALGQSDEYDPKQQHKAFIPFFEKSHSHREYITAFDKGEQKQVEVNEKGFQETSSNPSRPKIQAELLKHRYHRNPRITKTRASDEHYRIRRRNNVNRAKRVTDVTQKRNPEYVASSQEMNLGTTPTFNNKMAIPVGEHYAPAAYYTWQNCLDISSIYFPEIIDNSFASFTTRPRDRDRVRDVIDSIAAALLQDILSSEHLNNKTKDFLNAKAVAMTKRIAVPWVLEFGDRHSTKSVNDHGDHTEETFPSDVRGRYPIPVNHDQIGINGKSFYDDTLRARQWVMRLEIESYKKMIHNDFESIPQLHFEMSTHNTNAFYDPTKNDINILAGIMKPPFYHYDYTHTSLFATIGSIIGHEMSHAFDANSVYFDKVGSLNYSWFKDSERSQYEEKEACFVKQYKAHKTLLGNTVNAQSTLGENMADNAGLQASWDALMVQLTKSGSAGKEGKKLTVEEKRDIAQEFTLAYAQMWCSGDTKDGETLQILMDVHAPSQIRVDRTLSNLFDKQTGKYVMDLAWNCTTKNSMVNSPVCTLW